MVQYLHFRILKFPLTIPPQALPKPPESVEAAPTASQTPEGLEERGLHPPAGGQKVHVNRDRKPSTLW